MEGGVDELGEENLLHERGLCVMCGVGRGGREGRKGGREVGRYKEGCLPKSWLPQEHESLTSL